MDDIIKYLEKNDTDAYKTAKQAMKCFEPFGKDEGQSYARASALVSDLCEGEVMNLLTEIRSKISHYNSDHENVFSTEQNALIAVNAEKYYRAMMKGGPQSWNIRDRHMVSTLDRLMKFHGENSKTIIWEHNTHIGDARATDMASEGMVNVGQLVTEQHAEEGVVSVGFGSYRGSVIAGRNWGDMMREIKLPKAIDGSWEHIFHIASRGKNKLLIMDKVKDEDCVSSYIGHRAVGVVYNPEYEKLGNYVPTILPMRYDAFIYIDETTALHPLHIEADGHQTPETFPFGV
jgi:erythromycin esterase-like protein